MKTLLALIGVCTLLSTVATAQPAASRIAFQEDQAKGQITIVIDGKPALVYQHGPQVDLPHYFPVHSPSGRAMTVQQIEPYPHHRSFWFADTLKLEGQRRVSFYAALYTGVKPPAPATRPAPAPATGPAAPKPQPKAPFKDRIRHVSFVVDRSEPAQARFTTKLAWEADDGKMPVLDEVRSFRLVALGEGQWFLDMTFAVTATHGPVTFESDAVHYAWPFLRMADPFTPRGGTGTIVNSEGGIGEKLTNMKPAKWVDYSSTTATGDGAAAIVEGLALMSHATDNPHPHKWLTRDYGTFGPRRTDERSGKPFTLQKGQTLSTRCGLYVHKGDAKAADVAGVYDRWVGGKL